HCLAISDDLLSILLKHWQLAASRSRSNDDMLCLDYLFLVVRTSYFHLSFACNLSHSHHHINLILLHEKLYPATHLIRHTTAPLYHGRKIRLARRFNAKILRVFNVFVHLGALKQGLSWNTAPVKANASKTFLFNDCSFKS